MTDRKSFVAFLCPLEDAQCASVGTPEAIVIFHSRGSIENNERRKVTRENLHSRDQHVRTVVSSLADDGSPSSSEHKSTEKVLLCLGQCPSVIQNGLEMKAKHQLHGWNGNDLSISSRMYVFAIQSVSV